MYVVKSFLLFIVLASVGTLRQKLNKAFHGYMTSDLHPTPSGQRMAVATGNWGCGAFGESLGNLFSSYK